MTDPLFLHDALGASPPRVGSTINLGGAEGRHASVVRRIGPGEMIMIADGRGAGVRAEVVSADPSGLVVEVRELLSSRERSTRYLAAQALAKGDRSELAIEMLTELGIDGIVPWQATRSVVRWSGERAEKSLRRWRSTVREAAKQSRRLRVPEITDLCSTRQLVARISEVDLALVLHEESTQPIAQVQLPSAGTVMIIIGPEGGITDAELEAFVAAGGQPVTISDGVLRSSTAGVVALARLLLQ